MTDTVIPRTPQAQPQDEATAVAVAVDGDTLQAFVGESLHLSLWAFRPVVHRRINWTDSAEPVTDQDPGSVGATHRIRFRCSPWAEHLGVAIMYQRGRASGTPYIRAEVRDGAGTVTDPGVEWTTTDGTLPSTASGRGDSRVWEIALLDTPVRVEATPGARGRPRLLNVDSGDRGTTIEVRASTNNCRALSVHVFEYGPAAVDL